MFSSVVTGSQWLNSNDHSNNSNPINGHNYSAGLISSSQKKKKESLKLMGNLTQTCFAHKADEYI